MKLPKLPEPTFVDQRSMYTRRDMLTYGAHCWALGRMEKANELNEEHQDDMREQIKKPDDAVDFLRGMMGMK